MDLELYDCGCPVGTLHMERTGLYQTVTCVCHPQSEGILRVYVWHGTEGACLGVLCPEGQDYTLRKRVSRAGLPFVPQSAVIGCEEQDFWPFRGVYEGKEIADGYLRHGAAGDELAVPFSEGMEYPFVHRLSCTETVRICGRVCVLLKDAPQSEKAKQTEDASQAENAMKTEDAPQRENTSETPQDGSVAQSLENDPPEAAPCQKASAQETTWPQQSGNRDTTNPTTESTDQVIVDASSEKPEENTRFHANQQTS